MAQRMETASTHLSSEMWSLREPWAAVKLNARQFKDRRELEAEYFELFEVTRKKAPCPLYESFYRDEDRNETMAELVRFYNFFGLTLGTSAREMPDHLKVEMEFLHYLTFLESAYFHDESAPDSLLKAQHDFHKRHLQCWTGQLWDRIYHQESQYFRSITDLARAFITVDQEYAAERIHR